MISLDDNEAKLTKSEISSVPTTTAATTSLRMKVRVVRFDESANKSTEEKKECPVKRRGKRNGIRMSGPSKQNDVDSMHSCLMIRSPHQLFRLYTAINATALATTYEALKSSDRRDEVNGFVTDDVVVAFCVRCFLDEMFEDFDLTAGDIANGLQRLQDASPDFVSLSLSAKAKLARISQNCPALAAPHNSSSITSNGTLFSVDLDFDETEKLAAFRVAITAAFEEAKKRNTNKTEFAEEAGKIFNTDKEEYVRAFQHVVDDFGEDSWNGTDGSATVHSLSDAISRAANSAFSTWSKCKSIAAFNHLYLFVFKLQKI